MKKIFILTALLLIGNINFAETCEIKCVEPYDLSSSVSQFFSTLTGQRFLSEKIGEKIIKKAIKKNLISGEIKSDVESFSAKDFKAGRFKSVKISGNDINFQGIHISSFEAKTLCNFNYITEDKNGDIFFKEDMPMSVSVTMTEDDINETMKSSDYKRLVDNINNLGGNFNIFNIESTSAKIKNNKLYYIVKYSIPFVRKSKEVAFSADLRVENGQIKLANTTYENNSMSLDMDKFSKIINYINPLDFSAKILENKNAKFNIENIKIEDNKITADGKVIVLKDEE